MAHAVCRCHDWHERHSLLLRQRSVGMYATSVVQQGLLLADFGVGVADHQRWTLNRESQYFHILQLKMAYVERIVAQEFNVLLADADIVWRENAFEALSKQVGERSYCCFGWLLLLWLAPHSLWLAPYCCFGSHSRVWLQALDANVDLLIQSDARRNVEVNPNAPSLAHVILFYCIAGKTRLDLRWLFLHAFQRTHCIVHANHPRNYVFVDSFFDSVFSQ